MRGASIPAIPISPSYSHKPSFIAPLITVRRFHRSTTATVRSGDLGLDCHYQNNATKYWDNFYKRHQNKFFKDRHYLEKDWGRYFSDDSVFPNGKVVLEVGCGAGNTIFPLVATYPKLYVHACDFSPHAIKLVKLHGYFREDRINAFVCNVIDDDLSDKIIPSSVDVVTLFLQRRCT